MKKILQYVPILIVGLITVLTLWSEFGGTSSSIPDENDALQEYVALRGGTMDDSKWEMPNFRVMSDVDTTVIDQKIEKYYKGVLEGNADYLGLSDAQIGVRLKDICSYYDDICDRIHLQYDFTMKEIYNFTVFTTYLVTQIDDNILLDGVATLRTTLGKIIFDKNTNDPRGMAGHHNMLINTYEMKDRRELLKIITHELGHVMDLGVIEGDSEHKNENYKEFGKAAFATNDWSIRFYGISREEDEIKRSFTRNAHLVSMYGHTNIYEDFAEFFNAWINHHAPLLELAKSDDQIRKKYFLFKELFGKRYLNNDIDLYKELDVNTRPYDTTKWLEHLTPIE